MTLKLLNTSWKFLQMASKILHSSYVCASLRNRGLPRNFRQRQEVPRDNWNSKKCQVYVATIQPLGIRNFPLTFNDWLVAKRFNSLYGISDVSRVHLKISSWIWIIFSSFFWIFKRFQIQLACPFVSAELFTLLSVRESLSTSDDVWIGGLMRSAYSCNASRKARRTGVELQTVHSTRRGYNSTTCSQIRPSTATQKRKWLGFTG